MGQRIMTAEAEVEVLKIRLLHYLELHELIQAEQGEIFSAIHEMQDITAKLDEIEELYGE